MRIAVVIPVFNDWEAGEQVVAQLAEHAPGHKLSVIVVDDGSTTRCPWNFATLGRNLARLTVLQLERNVGHQRAIACGLCFVNHEIQTDVVCVMDGDGEDLPAAMAKLCEEAARNAGAIVVAQRGRRHESLTFRALYRCYKLAFGAITGTVIDFGNFVAMDADGCRRLGHMHETWLHFPAAIIASKLPVLRMPTDRGHRLAGQSKMNLPSLVSHGLRSIAVFAERALTRVSIAAGVFLGFALFAFAVALGLKAVDNATPGWLTTVGGIAIASFLQVGIIALVSLFVVQSGDQFFDFDPVQRYKRLINRVL